VRSKKKKQPKSRQVKRASKKKSSSIWEAKCSIFRSEDRGTLVRDSSKIIDSIIRNERIPTSGESGRERIPIKKKKERDAALILSPLYR